MYYDRCKALPQVDNLKETRIRFGDMSILPRLTKNRTKEKLHPTKEGKEINEKKIQNSKIPL